MLNSNVCQPMTQWYSLMWYPPISRWSFWLIRFSEPREIHRIWWRRIPQSLACNLRRKLFQTRTMAGSIIPCSEESSEFLWGKKSQMFYSRGTIITVIPILYLTVVGHLSVLSVVMPKVKISTTTFWYSTVF